MSCAQPIGFTEDFRFRDRDFDWLRNLASRESGIVLPRTKRTMIYSRLAKRLRSLGLQNFSHYRDLLENGDGTEMTEFINALTTNLTSFFREPHHFRHLQDVLLPRLQAERGKRMRLRIWSAGCSTGEEPYSISLAVGDAMRELGGDWDVEIVATDLDTAVLARAEAGIYPAECLEGLEPDTRRRWFLRGTGPQSGKVRVRKELRSRLTFRQLNLIKEWPSFEPFDVIFCRNVAIYFDKPTQKQLYSRFGLAMTPAGYLYVGHSESLFQVADHFHLVGKTIYRVMEPRHT